MLYTLNISFFLPKLIEVSPTGIVILGKENKVETINPAAQRILNIRQAKETIELSSLGHPWRTALIDLNENMTNTIQANGLNQYKCYKSVFLDKGIKRTFFIHRRINPRIAAS